MNNKRYFFRLYDLTIQEISIVLGVLCQEWEAKCTFLINHSIRRHKIDFVNYGTIPH